MFFLSFLAIVGSWIVYRGYKIFNNYQLAKSLGLPIVFVPFTWQDPLWIIVCNRLAFLKNIPGFSWYNYSYIGYSLYDRFGSHAKYGLAFTVVSIFGKNEIITADNESIIEVVSKWKQWLKPKELYDIFTTFGDNVQSAPREHWGRHRKVLSAGFREQNNRLVWDAAKKQATQWLSSIRDNRRDLKQLEEDMSTISMDTLMYAGFGQNLNFSDAKEQEPKGHKLSFFMAMRFMMLNMIQAWAFKALALPRWLEPRYLRELQENHADLTHHFDDILRTQQGDFVKAMHEANEVERRGGREYLSTQELYGNMFILQLAGTDTTTNAMVHAIAMLASNPKYQDWIRESLPDQLGEYDAHELNVRCLATLYETVRYYGSAPNLGRYSDTVQELTINGTAHTIPPFTYLSCNIPATGHNPLLWGSDVDEWKPERFVQRNETDEECLRTQPAFLGWSVGPRYCIGKKFSNVEFTAVISTLLLQYNIRASSNMKNVVDDSEFRVSPKIKHGERGVITFIKR